jgi:hypothetical protein
MKKTTTKKTNSSKGLVKSALLNAIQSHDTTTTNGAVSHSTSGVYLVDFFGKAGAMRGQDDGVINLFSKAYSEDKNLALKVMFYLSDVRGGQGERNLFRLCFKWLIKNDVKVAKKLLSLIPEYTRWDLVLEITENTDLEKDALKILSNQLKVDSNEEFPSLAGKWAPSEQASSSDTKRLAGKVRTYMKLSPKNYRKLLSGLRAKINIVERAMCSGEWKGIDFSKVPSKAMNIYRKAFDKHAHDKFSNFLTKVEKGEVKINASVLYPYDVTKKAMHCADGNDLRTLDAQWNALPDYFDGEGYNALVLADFSGSMSCGVNPSARPIDVSTSLALYIAERNKGLFHNYFLVFSSDAELKVVTGQNIRDKIQNAMRDAYMGSTNIQAAFDLILSKALQHKVPESEMPKKLIIISDGQWDSMVNGGNKTTLENAKDKYKRAGYKIPEIIFWNVNARDDMAMKYDDKGVAQVSGCSPAILKSVLTGKVTTPYDLMVKTVSVERYEPVHA